MTIDQMREKLKIALTEKRYNHSIGVMQTAVELAHHYGADVHKTAVAALLHDCAKNYSTAEMFELCERFNIKIDETSKASPGLIHGFLGAVIASKYYGVDDPEIYDAIYYHTVGKPDMSLITRMCLRHLFCQQPLKAVFERESTFSQVVQNITIPVRY